MVLKQPLERDRGESSCISVLALAATLDLPQMPRHLAIPSECSSHDRDSGRG